jgi:hypothetical protein
MSIMGKVASIMVKAMAEATVARGVESVATAAINHTGLLKGATQTTKTVVKVGTYVGSAAVGSAVVNKLVDKANADGYPITGKAKNIEIRTYTHDGVLVGTPEHKKNKSDSKGSTEVIEVEVMGT